MTVTLVMPTLPERGSMLGEALSDWASQTVPLNEIRVGVDHARQGPAVIRNALCSRLRTEWIAFGDDDDRFDPNHLETLLAHSEHADVVWSSCRIEGDDTWTIDHRCPPDHGQIPMTCLMRRDAFYAVGGFSTEYFNEDEAVYAALKDAGARFVCCHDVTWTYRIHEGSRSRNQLPEGWEDAMRAKIAAGAEPTELTRTLLGR